MVKWKYVVHGWKDVLNPLKKEKAAKKLNKKCKKSERITWWNGKSCKWMNVKNGRTRRCCSYKNYCAGKKCTKKK